MKTFRMVNDERPTKHMINLERKMGGYCSISRINTPNPNYVGPELGGIDDPIINPKNILLTNPKDVRLRMRNFMQTIYEIQGDVTPEEEHVLSFLRGNGDDAVIEELARRKLTNEEMLSLEGPISKMEMKEQLFHHMKPASDAGQDGFTVRWIKHFWTDLEDLCHCSLKGWYEEKELNSMMKTAIMKIEMPY